VVEDQLSPFGLKSCNCRGTLKIIESPRVYELDSILTFMFLQKTTEEKVLEAAKTESKNVVLVYASDKAMDFAPKPLPLALEVGSLYSVPPCITNFSRLLFGTTTCFSKPNLGTRMHKVK
jgi:hypothetical protein